MSLKGTLNFLQRNTFKVLLWLLFVSSAFTSLAQTCIVSSGFNSNVVVNTNGSISATLSWDEVSNVEIYQIQYNREGYSAASISNLTLSSVALINLFANTNYRWRVRARCSGTWSTWTSYQTFATPDGVSCEIGGGHTSNLVINANGSIGATLSWNEVSASDAYQLQYIREGYSATSISNLTSPSVELFNLFANTNYTWRVRVRCNGVWSSWPATYESFTTPDGVSCEISGGHASNVIVNTNGSLSARLSWNEVPASDAYQLQYIREGYSAVSISNLTSPNAELINLFANTNYTWRVRVRCNGVWSSWPAMYESFTTADGISCEINGGHSSNVIVNTNGSLSATLLWNEVTASDAYQLQYIREGYSAVSISNLTSPNSELINLFANTNYTWRVRVRCNGVWSPWPSTYESFTTSDGVSCEISGGYTSDVIVNSNGSLGATLSWNEVTASDAYQLQYIQEGYSAVSISNLTSAGVALANLFANTNYTWRVRVRCNGVWSLWPSTYEAFTTPDGISCEINGGHTSDVSFNSNGSISADLSWNVVDIAEVYQLQYIPEGGSVLTLNNITSLSVTLNNLLDSTNYTWRVRVRCNGTWSSWPSTYQDFNTYKPLEEGDSLIVAPIPFSITRDGRQLKHQVEREIMLSELGADDEFEIFKAPPCLEGNYYAAIQMEYDLGDKQTEIKWKTDLIITLKKGNENIWTKTLELSMEDQTFISTVFHELPINCGEDYRVLIVSKNLLLEVPQENIYLRVLLYKVEDELFDPATSVSLHCNYESLAGETTLSWTTSGKNISEYDLEWMFIADHENFNGATAQDAFSFKEAVRITTPKIYYKHLTYYPTGSIWYRIRAVGYHPDYPEHRIMGQWSYSPCEFIRIENHQPEKNWLEQTVFAEAGKYKKVMSYFDGSLRQRQSLTNLNTDYVTLVGEAMYDYEGRKSVDILAVPSSDVSLKYRSAFNQFQAIDPIVGNNTSSERNKFHYDNHRSINSPLSTNAGAGKYYSPSNEQLNDLKRNPLVDYIPDAEGYVYAQVEYINDGTGRIKRQSGIGKEFRMDGPHASYYFYGNPSDEELIRLFGSNVGKTSHYKKNLVVDPNGQVSVSYMDQEDRVIATALAGQRPENVDPLPSYTALSDETVTESVMSSNKKESAVSEISHKLLNVVPNTDYTFRYKLSALASEVESFGCQSCFFDLKIAITDPDGIPISLSYASGNQSPDGLSYERKNIIAESCTDSTRVNDIQFTNQLSLVGDYTITKTLTARELTLEQMRAIVESDTTVQQAIQNLQESYVLDPTECAICTGGCGVEELEIQKAIEDVTSLNCENILQQIIIDLKSQRPLDPEYEPTQEEIAEHELYCQYELCLKNTVSDIFDKRMARIQGWQMALDSSYQNAYQKDPFFRNGLSGDDFETRIRMQSELDNVNLGKIPFDSNHDGKPDPFAISVKGNILDVTDPSKTAFYINEQGFRDPSGYHILYYDLQSKRNSIGEENYQQGISEQRWQMYMHFYKEAKRKAKLYHTEYRNCPPAKRELLRSDELPKNKDEFDVWAEENEFRDEISDPELEMTYYSIKRSCGSNIVAEDSITIANHLKNYFTGYRENFFKLILTKDLGSHTSLNEIQNVISKYGCNLNALAVEDPAECLNDTTMVIVSGDTALLSTPTESSRIALSNSVNEIKDSKKSLNRQKKINFTELKEERIETYSSTAPDETLNRVAGISAFSFPLVEEADTELPSESEYSALIALYNATGGPDWSFKTGWSSANPDVIVNVSNWWGVQTNADGHVVGLDFQSNFLDGTSYCNRLTGALPEEIGDLIYLEYLSFGCNRLVSPIPSSIRNLQQLRHLDFSGNSFNQSIPLEITKLLSLEVFLANQAGFTGSIPEDIGSLIELNKIDLGSNSLTSSLPTSLGMLNKLEDIDISNNQIEGSIPSTIGNDNLLVYFRLNDNLFTGTVPATFVDLVNLKSLSLENNQLNGPLPEIFGGMDQLSFLTLANNQIDGPLPSSLGGLQSLTYLDFSNNKFEGSITTEFGQMTSLYFADLSNNRLSGDVPSTLRNLNRLTEFNLSHNFLNGYIPPELNDNTYCYFDISHNELTVTGLLAFVLSFQEGYYCDFGDSQWWNELLYVPQDSIDIKREFELTSGESASLTTSIDRNTNPPSKFQWFKFVDGINDTPLQPSASETGHTLPLNGVSALDSGYYYYRITNDALSYYDYDIDDYRPFTLTSRLQHLIINDADQTFDYDTLTMCIEYDTSNATLDVFKYTVDWNKVVNDCMLKAAEEDSFLTAYAIESLLEEQMTIFFQKHQMNCLERITEDLTYEYVPKEHHYTLYYYDQAGNLEQTVQPEGVHPLTLQQVAAFKRGNRTEPPHTLITLYQYNSLNQPIWQKTPDAGESQFWYNDKGQLRLSQNAQQHLDQNYSYTKYDEPGRVIEVGELGSILPLTHLLDKVDSVHFPMTTDHQLSDVTRTHYDLPANLNERFNQTNLRTRVAWIEVIDKNKTDTTATYYSYDIHGNVKSLLQQQFGLSTKRTDYVYDLISGNINYVMYQYGERDQFIHQYTYDADNRIVDVRTSSDGFIWNNEATYAYYRHGPLARVTLGEYNVQGLDYYYALQGWLKGVNLPYEDDPGGDGKNGSMIGKDVFAFALGYYQNDFKPINASRIVVDTRDKLWTRLQDSMDGSVGLYNGNISWMVTDLPGIAAAKADRTKGMQAMLYRYDQLHRIVKARSFTSYNSSTGFSARPTTPAPYDVDYTYDANGNLLTLTRNNALGGVQDDFTYGYYAGTNKLREVIPVTRDTVYNSGPITQSNHKVYRNITIEGNAYVPSGAKVKLSASENIFIHENFRTEEDADFFAHVLGDNEGTYQYDAIGNLIADLDKGVKISWTPYGKVREVKTKSDSVVVSFRYDASGNRIEKRILTLSSGSNWVESVTHYVRDASGNVMATYNDTTVTEQPIYGSSRAGMYTGNVKAGYRTLGHRKFELSNHLGNILTVISDRVNIITERQASPPTGGGPQMPGQPRPPDPDGPLLHFPNADVVSVSDYYPFGLEMEGRTWSDSTAYRYGFNGKEKDDKGEWGSTVYDYGFRIYDPRFAKFLSVDPLMKEYPMLTPYQFASNRPIDGIDRDGLEYIAFHHYANGAVAKTEFYKMTDTDIKRLGGTTAGIHNSVPYGSHGKGIIHYYYNDMGDRTDTYWEQRQTGGSSDFEFHGLYSGPGSITHDGLPESVKYNFNNQPIDWADAIAKRHDLDYANATVDGGDYAGYLEDVRTLQADMDMVKRIDDLVASSVAFGKQNGPAGVETPVRTSYSTEMDYTLLGQRVLINALATYKQWKIDNNLRNDDLYKENREAFKEVNPVTAKILDQTQ